MGVIVFACVFCTGYGLSVMSTHPDARVGKYSRKSTMRGDFKDPTNQEDEEVNGSDEETVEVEEIEVDDKAYYVKDNKIYNKKIYNN